MFFLQEILLSLFRKRNFYRRRNIKGIPGCSYESEMMMMVGRFHNDVVNEKRLFELPRFYLLISTHILVIFVLAHYSLYDTRAIKQKSFFGRFISLKECGGEGGESRDGASRDLQSKRAEQWPEYFGMTTPKRRKSNTEIMPADFSLISPRRRRKKIESMTEKNN